MTWQPWVDYEQNTPEKLAIEEPPCKLCRHWHPHCLWRHGRNGLEFDGVELCTAKEMYPDFSCFKERNDKLEVL